MTRFLLLALALSGCAQSLPAISDIRSDVVKVQAYSGPFLALPSQAAIDAEAERGCAEYGNTVSHSLSRRCLNPNACSMWEYLYACKSPET